MCCCKIVLKAECSDTHSYELYSMLSLKSEFVYSLLQTDVFTTGVWWYQCHQSGNCRVLMFICGWSDKNAK